MRPFEDAASLEFWAQKNDASLFVVGQSTKKRPNGLTFVRMFDYRVLDMCEVGVEGWKSIADFKVSCAFSLCAVGCAAGREGGGWASSDRTCASKVKTAGACPRATPLL